MSEFNDGTLPIDAPLVVENPEAARWDASCDLLIAGFGAAGAAAAITAREAGADVLVVDRFNSGGASARSGGVIYAGGGTPYQLKHGYEDTPEAMFNYLRQEVGGAVSDATLRRFCDDSRGLLAWLESLGASFDSEVAPPKTSYPKDGVYLYFSGNESVKPFCDAAPPAPRGHRTVDKGLSGKTFFAYLRRKVEALGVPVRGQASVRQLITGPDDAVLGAIVAQLPQGSAAARRHARIIRWAEVVHNVAPKRADRMRAKALALELAHAQITRIRARRGVLLATGGFIFNREMMAQHAPKFARNMRLGTTGCDGSGIRLGLSVGAQTDRLNKASAWRFINPPTAWPRGIAVSENGERFCNEASYGARLGVTMCEEHDGRAWLIIDKAIRDDAMRESWTGGLWSFQKIPAILSMLFAPRAASIAELARRLGMPPAALEAAVADNNRAAAQQTADPLGKAGPMQGELRNAPYFALNISAGQGGFPCPTITLGGLRVDEDSGAVLGEGGQPIPGLYAAGRCAVGIASNGYVSGLSLADCLWSGRRAGRSIAGAGEDTAAAAA